MGWLMEKKAVFAFREDFLLEEVLSFIYFNGLTVAILIII